MRTKEENEEKIVRDLRSDALHDLSRIHRTLASNLTPTNDRRFRKQCALLRHGLERVPLCKESSPQVVAKIAQIKALLTSRKMLG